MKIAFKKPRKALTPKQKAFVLAYLKTGNATASAREAGYGGGERALEAAGSRLLRNVIIRAELEEHGRAIDKPKIADLEEVLEVLTKEIRSTAPEHGNVRVRAAQLLGKRYGAYISPARAELEAVELQNAKHVELMSRLESEDKKNRYGQKVSLFQENMTYPAGGPGVGVCGRYHAALDPALYPNSPLLTVVAPACPLCGRVKQVVPTTPQPTSEALAALDDSEEDL